MRDEWSLDELVASWTLVGQDWDLVGNKTGATRLGFALMLKFFELEARFPSTASQFADVVVGFVARQVNVVPGELVDYAWDGRSASAHRVQMREAFGFRICTRADEAMLTQWLAESVCPTDDRPDHLRNALLGECRRLRVEPPGRMDRIVGSARNMFEKDFCERTAARLDATQAAALEALIDEGSEAGLLVDLKSEPGQLGLETLLREITKLNLVRDLNLPSGLFDDMSPRIVEAWRARATRAYRSDLAGSSQPVR